MWKHATASALALLAALVASTFLVAVPGAVTAAELAVAPTPGALNVRDFGALGDGTGDDTAAFAAALALASTTQQPRFDAGPGGAPQGVVYVPPGTYRLLNLKFPPNVRLEVDAAAVLEQAGGRYATGAKGYAAWPALILWDGSRAVPLRNVSIIGVGESTTAGVKNAASPVPDGWSVAGSFTFNLDPAATDANHQVGAIEMLHVDGFLIANVFSIQNDTVPVPTPTKTAAWWPSSRKAALVMQSRSDTPTDGSAFYDPHNGEVTNWYNVHGPRGFGPTQIESAHNVTFSQLFSRGGTALRLEADDPSKPVRSELRSITGDEIRGEACNRAVSFTPHAQNNYGVAVTNVVADRCYQGVIESLDESLDPALRGGFFDSTIANVTVTGGVGAQIPTADGAWKTGISSQAFARDGADPWAVVYTAGTMSCSGAFAWPSDTLQTTSGPYQPVCSTPNPDATVPKAPATPTAILSLRNVNVEFAPVTDDGGSPITSYTATSTPEGRTVTGTQSPLFFGNLTSGVTYTFTVVATNAVGNSLPSSPSRGVTPFDPSPIAPPRVTAVAKTSAKIRLNWKMVTGAQSYVVSRSLVSGGPYSVIGSTAELVYLDTHLRRSTTYYYVVQSVMATGQVSPYSVEVFATTLAS